MLGKVSERLKNIGEKVCTPESQYRVKVLNLLTANPGLTLVTPPRGILSLDGSKFQSRPPEKTLFKPTLKGTEKAR